MICAIKIITHLLDQDLSLSFTPPDVLFVNIPEDIQVGHQQTYRMVVDRVVLRTKAPANMMTHDEKTCVVVMAH